MKKLLVLIVCAFSLVLSSAASTARIATADSSVLHLDYVWKCSRPCQLPVWVSPDFPANMQTIIDNAFSAWNSTGVVHFYRTTDGTVPRSMRPQNDGFTTTIKTKGPWMTWARSEFDYKWFDWEGMPFVVCHELSHMLGFNDGVPAPPNDPNTCPTTDHFSQIAVGYGG